MRRTLVRIALIGAVMLGAAVILRIGLGQRSADPPAAPEITIDTAAGDPELAALRADIEAERSTAAIQLRSARAARLTGLPFAHAEHRGLDCLQCHRVTDAHGTLTVSDVGQCRECHHAAPLAADCSSCHDAADFTGERLRVPLTFRLSVATPLSRETVFAHVQHRTVECEACHTAAVTMAVTGVCSNCHEDHHQPQNQCMACHTAPPRPAHTVQAHVSCTGAGCHDPAPITASARSRSFCLVCHQELVAHEPAGNCIDCHRLPPARTPTAGPTPADAR